MKKVNVDFEMYNLPLKKFPRAEVITLIGVIIAMTSCAYLSTLVPVL